MSNLYLKYETDPRKEADGVPFEFDGVTFFIRRAGGNNRSYRYALAAAAAGYRHIFAAADKDPAAIFAANEHVQQIAFSEAVIVGWQNMEGRDGQPLEFSKEAALDLIIKCPAVWDQLKGFAIDDDNFRPEKEDAEALGKQ